MSDTSWRSIINACTQAEGLMALGRHDDAAQVLRTALTSAPDSPELQGDLARAELGRNRFAAAERTARSALFKAPENARLLLILASTLNAQDRIDEAISCCERAVALAPHDPHAHAELARALVRRLPATRRTLEECNLAVSLAPSWSLPHVIAGRHYEVNRELATAARAYQSALALDPDNADALMGLARIGTSTAESVELSRRAGRARLDDTRPMQLLRSRARTRVAVMLLVYTAPLAWLVAAVLGPATDPATAAFDALVLWVVLALLLTLRLTPIVSRRWAEGRSTRWLFDDAITSGRSPRQPEMRAGLTFLGAILVLGAVCGFTMAIAHARAVDEPVPVVAPPGTAPPASLLLPDGSVVMVPDADLDPGGSNDAFGGLGFGAVVGPLIAVATALSARWFRGRRHTKGFP